MQFLDTNVLVYAVDHDAGDKRLVARELLQRQAKAGDIVLSTQVLAEFYYVVTRKFERKISTENAISHLKLMARLRVIGASSRSVIAAAEIGRRYKLSIWDALIVEAAQRGGCERILTEDLSHGQKFGKVEIHDPFRDLSA